MGSDMKVFATLILTVLAFLTGNPLTGLLIFAIGMLVS
jgi:hypothetical protein